MNQERKSTYRDDFSKALPSVPVTRDGVGGCLTSHGLPVISRVECTRSHGADQVSCTAAPSPPACPCRSPQPRWTLQVQLPCAHAAARAIPLPGEPSPSPLPSGRSHPFLQALIGCPW